MRIGLLQIFAEIYFADQGFPLATSSLGGRLIHYLLTVTATSCSASRFALLVELRLGPSWFVCLSSSTTRLKLETPPRRLQLVLSKKLTMAAPRNLEAFALKQQYSAMLLLTSTQYCKSRIPIILFPHYTTDSREI